MLNPTRLIVGMACSSAIVSSACSHEWDNLSPNGDTEISSSGASTESSSGSGAGGSGNDCAPLMPAVPQCGNVVGTFDNQMQFDADWSLSGKPGQIKAVNGVASLSLGPADTTVFAGTTPDFTFTNCGVWVQIVETSVAADVMVRLSISNPGVTNRFSLGILAQNLTAYGEDAMLFSIPYDAASMRYVRMREEAGNVLFGYSVDGRCWTEIGKAMDTLTGPVEGRIAITHIPAGKGTAGSGKFDNYCVQVP